MLTFAAAPPTPTPKSNTNHPYSSSTPRKPLQPKNHLPTNINNNPSSKNLFFFDTNNKNHHESNKENDLQHPPPAPKTSSYSLLNNNIVDASLAEELKAIREKMERMRLDKEETEKMLRDRELLLDTQMGQLFERGNLQRMLEIQVDRLYRLNQLTSSCLVSPIRSLRDKEIARKINGDAKSRSMKIESSKCASEVIVSGSTSPKSETSSSSALQHDYMDQASEIDKDEV